ncbi:MAG: hypothetical protein HOP29_14910 [Phycisphaerales bacterium]|nr:hypothetical protein [Phycisphaerales bacterium]
MHRAVFALIVSTALLASGCDQKSDTPNAGSASAPAANTQTPSPAANKQSQPPAASKGTESAKGPGHGGAVIELGETTLDGVTVRASRDQGEIKPGGDSPIDIWLDGGLGNAAAVRFWVGTQDGNGSIKAKAAVEDAHWHTHAEVPDPLPADSKLWVEIEAKNGKKATVSFDLNK